MQVTFAFCENASFSKRGLSCFDLKRLHFIVTDGLRCYRNIQSHRVQLEHFPRKFLVYSINKGVEFSS